jgi:hypothetical protein
MQSATTYSSSSKQHLKAKRARLVDRRVRDQAHPGLRRQQGRDEPREALVLWTILEWGRVGGGKDAARAGPSLSTWQFRSQSWRRARICTRASPVQRRKSRATCGVSSAWPSATLARIWCLSKGRAMDSSSVLEGFGNLKRVTDSSARLSCAVRRVCRVDEPLRLFIASWGKYDPQLLCGRRRSDVVQTKSSFSVLILLSALSSPRRPALS